MRRRVKSVPRSNENKGAVRVGDYRVKYTGDDGRLRLVDVKRLRHQKDVYR